MILFIQSRKDKSKEHEQECVNRFLKEGQKIQYLSVYNDETNFSNVEELLKGVDKLIVGGSGELSLVRGSEEEKEEMKHILEKMNPLIEHVKKNDLPFLGICFGFQVLSHFLGVKVEARKDLAEVGFGEIFLTKEGRGDRIFAEVKESFDAAVGHKDSVASLPENVLHLAGSKKCPIQAYRYKENVYSIQFHPELNYEDILFRISLYPSYRDNNEGAKIEKKDISEATKILKNFLSFS